MTHLTHDYYFAVAQGILSTESIPSGDTDRACDCLSTTRHPVQCIKITYESLHIFIYILKNLPTCL